MNLLIVDFDFFFPTPSIHDEDPESRRLWAMFDWTHAETPFHIGPLWDIRASDFYRVGLDLPRTDGTWRSFWSRFRIAKRAQLFVADSNMYAVHQRVARNIEGEVWLYDAHHDGGYQPEHLERYRDTGQVTCEDWGIYYHDLLERPYHMRYPGWRHWALKAEPAPQVEVDRQVDDGSTPPVTFGRVFLCRSGAWVPSWVDPDFEEFIRIAPVQRVVRLEDDPALPREWDDEEARAQGVSQRAALAELSAFNQRLREQGETTDG